MPGLQVGHAAYPAQRVLRKFRFLASFRGDDHQQVFVARLYSYRLIFLFSCALNYYLMLLFGVPVAIFGSFEMLRDENEEAEVIEQAPSVPVKKRRNRNQKKAIVPGSMQKEANSGAKDSMPAHRLPSSGSSLEHVIAKVVGFFYRAVNGVSATPLFVDCPPPPLPPPPPPHKRTHTRAHIPIFF